MIRIAWVPKALLLLVGLQPTVIASRAPHLLLEQSVMTRFKESWTCIARQCCFERSRSRVVKPARLHSARTARACRLITYWPARSIFISGAGPEFRRNSRRASPVNARALYGTLCERGVLSEFRAARARASYWFDKEPRSPVKLGINVKKIRRILL